MDDNPTGVRTPEFLTITNPQDSIVLRLSSYSKKISTLLQAHANSQTGIQACLDDLLGAVYNLFHAVHLGYADRSKPLSTHDLENVVVRARDMGNGRVRTEGKWTAGVYFNNALFRLAGVYHRSLKISSGIPSTRRIEFRDLIERVQESYRALKGSSWDNKNIVAVYREVNDLKHTPEGVARKRDVTLSQALHAVNELLSLIEVLCH